jgi:ankyrin repeat protein
MGRNTACVFGLSRTFTILFESRFSIELEDSYLDQPLLYACEFGYLKLVQYLLEEGANAAADIKDVQWTPLHYAATQGHLELTRLLLDHGADFSAVKAGWTPLHCAARQRHEAVDRKGRRCLWCY